MNDLIEQTVKHIEGSGIKESVERKAVNERNMQRDESYLKEISPKEMNAFQAKEFKKLADRLFSIIGPSSRNYKVYRDSRLDDDIEVHFKTPSTGLTLSSNDLSYLSKVKFFYINIGRDKIVVTFLG